MRLALVVAAFFLFSSALAARADTLSVFTITGASQFASGIDQNTISGTATIDTTTGTVDSIAFIAGGIAESGVDFQSGTNLYVGAGALHFTISGVTLVNFKGDNFNLVGPNDQYVGQVDYDGSYTTTAAAVTPEPASLLLLLFGTGLLGITAVTHRRCAAVR